MEDKKLYAFKKNCKKLQDCCHNTVNRILELMTKHPEHCNDLCNYVKVLFLENIPEISKSQNDLARRFINLIDIIYEGKVQLICLSSRKIDDIYNGTKLKKEFKRTISRLNEMQASDWIN